MRGRHFLVGLLTVLAILAVFLQTAGHGFLNLDDDRYILLNPRVNTGLTSDNIIWAFTGTASSNWHPLTWISHMADVELFGVAPGGHHLVNVFLHIANVLCLLLLLCRMTGSFWPSALVAALFAVHPLHVESVAWVAERKDVLSTLLGLLALFAYLRYVRQPSPRRYLLTLWLFTLGLMAKPMLVTLPAVLLLLDFWPLGRCNSPAFVRRGAGRHREGSSNRLLVEKIPFVAVSLISAIITLKVQQASGAVKSTDLFPLAERLANAIVSCVTYIGVTVWPRGLAVYYPHPAGRLSAWAVVAAAGVLLLISATAILKVRQRPHLLAGWLWYLITLTPVIGLVQVGTQARADRYTYTSLIGLFIAIAWLLPRPHRKAPQTMAVWFLVTASLIPFALAARIQVGHWKDSITLLRHALDIVSAGQPQAPPHTMILYFNLGNAYSDRKEHDTAIEAYKRAIADYPRHPGIHYNLGNSYAALGQHWEALRAYQAALSIEPDLADVYYNMAQSYLMLGFRQESAAAHARAAALDGRTSPQGRE